MASGSKGKGKGTRLKGKTSAKGRRLVRSGKTGIVKPGTFDF